MRAGGCFFARRRCGDPGVPPQRAQRGDGLRHGIVLVADKEAVAVHVLGVVQFAVDFVVEVTHHWILGEVAGYGFSCDAYHITAPCVDGEGAVSSMKLALESAAIAPEQVGYINAHGTSTDANDITESTAIKQVFGAYAKKGLMVSSTKSMTGHLLGAAGAIEAFFTVRALQEGLIPPTINLDNPAEGCDLDYVPHIPRQAKVQYAISNSFGFGGTNATIVLKAI